MKEKLQREITFEKFAELKFEIEDIANLKKLLKESSLQNEFLI